MRKPRLVLVGLPLVLAGTFMLGYWVSRARAAGVPQAAPLTYSGTLTDVAGVPLTGAKNVLLQVYSVATAGTSLCASAPTSVTLVAGTFQVPLGDDCTAVVHANQDLWIDVLIDGASIGRTKVGAVPYAIEADTAQHAAAASAAAGALATTITTLQTAVQTLQTTVGTLTCPTGFYQAGPNLCIESAATLHTATDMYTASSVCRTMQGGHVCTRNEMLQGCAAVGINGIPTTFNPFAATANGWFGDRGALDDTYIEWNSSVCSDNIDAPPITYATLLPFRCCK